MKPYVYAFLFAVFLLFLKAFYFDAWYKTKYSDNNVSFEENATSEQASTQEEVAQDDDFSRRGKGIEKISPEEALEKNEGNSSGMKDGNPPLRSTGMYDKEKMPIDKLGDSIANTLSGKISN